MDSFLRPPFPWLSATRINSTTPKIAMAIETMRICILLLPENRTVATTSRMVKISSPAETLCSTSLDHSYIRRPRGPVFCTALRWLPLRLLAMGKILLIKGFNCYLIIIRHCNNSITIICSILSLN